MKLQEQDYAHVKVARQCKRQNANRQVKIGNKIYLKIAETQLVLIVNELLTRWIKVDVDD